MLAALLQLLAAIAASSLALLLCRKKKAPPNGAALPLVSPSQLTPSGSSSAAKPPSSMKSPDVVSPPPGPAPAAPPQPNPVKKLSAAESKFEKEKAWNDAIEAGLERPAKDDESVDECPTDYGPAVPQPKPGEPFSDPMAGGGGAGGKKGVDSKKSLHSDKPKSDMQSKAPTEAAEEKKTTAVA